MEPSLGRPPKGGKELCHTERSERSLGLAGQRKVGKALRKRERRHTRTQAHRHNPYHRTCVLPLCWRRPGCEMPSVDAIGCRRSLRGRVADHSGPPPSRTCRAARGFHDGRNLPPKHERLATLRPFGRKAQRRLCEKQEKVRISGLPFRRRPFELC